MLELVAKYTFPDTASHTLSSILSSLGLEESFFWFSDIYLTLESGSSISPGAGSGITSTQGWHNTSIVDPTTTWGSVTFTASVANAVIKIWRKT
jgi:hypothetical protein